MNAQAQSEGLAASVGALASVTAVVLGASVHAAGGGAAMVVPAALSVAGTVLVVVAVLDSPRGPVYQLERASDGAQASIQMVGQGVGHASLALGTAVTVSAIGAGTLLSAAGKAVAFIPNEMGRALLYNEQVTR